MGDINCASISGHPVFNDFPRWVSPFNSPGCRSRTWLRPSITISLVQKCQICHAQNILSQLFVFGEGLRSGGATYVIQVYVTCAGLCSAKQASGLQNRLSQQYRLPDFLIESLQYGHLRVDTAIFS